MSAARSRSRRARIVCAAFALLGCTEREVPAPRPEVVRAPDTTIGCELGPDRTWIDPAGSRGSLALAIHGDHGLVVYASGAELRARAITPDGDAIGERARIEAAGTEGLLALEPSASGYILVARGSCEASATCLVARALRDDGTLLGSAIASPLPAPIRTVRRASSAGPLFVAWSTSGGQRALERYAIGASGLAHTTIALGAEPASDEEPIEILGLAADGERWAVLHRRGPTEAITSAVFLTAPGSHRAIAALHDALTVDAIALDGDALSLTTTFEFARPHYLRIPLGADEPSDARELAAGAPIPAPLADRERAELDVDARGLWLRRRSAAGYPIGSRTPLAHGRVASAALARAGDTLLVTWLASGAVHARTVRCSEP